MTERVSNVMAVIFKEESDWPTPYRSFQGNKIRCAVFIQKLESVVACASQPSTESSGIDW